LKTIVKGAVLSQAVSVICLIIFAFLLTYADFPEKYIYPAVIAAYAVGVLAGSISVSLKIRSTGYLYGSLNGLIYTVILAIIKSVINKSPAIDADILITAAICVITGAVGGIVGANLSPASRKVKSAVKRRSAAL
jgi:putative membrane protein (TIGR04086 family)